MVDVLSVQLTFLRMEIFPRMDVGCPGTDVIPGRHVSCFHWEWHVCLFPLDWHEKLSYNAKNI